MSRLRNWTLPRLSVPFLCGVLIATAIITGNWFAGFCGVYGFVVGLLPEPGHKFRGPDGSKVKVLSTSDFEKYRLRLEAQGYKYEGLQR